MRFAVETGGTITADPDDVVDKTYLQHLFDRLAEALVEINEFEADVAVNFETHEVDFYVVVEAPTPQAALDQAASVVRRAFRRIDVKDEPEWDELHARRADLVPA